MAIEGSLSDVGLADICQLLAMGRKTGCLTVTESSNFGYVYFEGGKVTYASVLNRPDRLGELLVQNGVIQRSDLSAAMESQAQEPGKRLGQILVERGSLSGETLSRFITIQIEEAVYHLFAWNEGNFRFNAGQKAEESNALQVLINTESLLLEGARRVDEWSQIEKKIPSMDIIFSIEREPGEEEGLELSADQKKLLPLIDGSRTVDDLVRESGFVEFDVAKAIYGLLQAGFLHRSGQKVASKAEVEEARGQQQVGLGTAYLRANMLEEAEREFRLALELEPENPMIRSHLALICLKSDRPAEALEYLDGVVGTAKPAYRDLRNRALALEVLDRHAEALEALAAADALRPGDHDTLLARGIVHLKAREGVQARDAFRRYADEERGELPALYYAFALLALAVTGDLDGAIALGREGAERHPTNAPILVNLGVVLELGGETESAEASFLRALSDPPPPAQAHKNLGDLAYRRGDQSSARAHFEKAIELDPELGDDVYLKLGNIAYREKDREWALLLWRRALKLNPGNEVVRTNLESLAATPGR